MTAERIQLRDRVNQNQILNCGPDPQAASSKPAEEVDDIPHVHIPISRHEATDDALDTDILAIDRAGSRVKSLVIAECILFDVVRKIQERRKGVGELKDTDGSNNGCEAGEVGDSGADDEGN